MKKHRKIFTIFSMPYRFCSKPASMLKAKIEKHEEIYNCRFSQMFLLGNEESDRESGCNIAVMLVIFFGLDDDVPVMPEQRTEDAGGGTIC